MLHGISWWQFIGTYLAIYIIIIAIVLFKKLPQLLKGGRGQQSGGTTAEKHAASPPMPANQDLPDSPLQKVKQMPIWQQPTASSPEPPMSENEMYDLASLALDDLDDLFGACVGEEWNKEELLQHLHRKLQGYTRLTTTKMYTNISSYIENQAVAITGIELSDADVTSLW